MLEEQDVQEEEEEQLDNLFQVLELWATLLRVEQQVLSADLLSEQEEIADLVGLLMEQEVEEEEVAEEEQLQMQEMVHQVF